jgi:hypothetical protein
MRLRNRGGTCLEVWLYVRVRFSTHGMASKNGHGRHSVGVLEF